MFKRYKYHFLIVYILIASLLLTNYVGRAEAEAVNAGALKIDYAGAPGSLFNNTNIAPGFEEIKSIVVTNTGKVAHSFSLAVNGGFGTLADAIIIEPRVSNSIVWSKTLSQIAKSPESNIIIGSIAPSEARTVEIKAFFPQSSGNQYQAATTFDFSFVMGNENTDAAEPADDSRGNIGAAGVSTRAQGLISLFTGPSGDEDSALAAAGIENTGEVKGANLSGQAQGEGTNTKNNCFWWLALAAIYAIFLVIFRNYVRKKDIIFAWVWPIFSGVVMYLVHWIMHDYYTLSKWCEYFIYIEIVLLILYYGSFRFFRPKQISDQ